MKKLFIVIAILSLIFVAMLINRYSMHASSVTVNEVSNIENYINKIYMYKEVTGEALPKFENINSADENWIWKVVKRNLEDYNLTYDQIQNKTVELFGSEFHLKFPKEGKNYLIYNKETNTYEAQMDIIDYKTDKFLMNNIEKTKNGYKVEIIEYLENHQNLSAAEAKQSEDDTSTPSYDIYIENLNEERLGIVNSINGESEKQQLIKNNADRFSKKTLYLTSDENGKLYINKVE